jgi:hydrogenase maturation protein HypF
VPEPIAVDYNNRILSVGAGENITGAISHDKNVFATQYIGNSKYYSTLEFLEEALRHFMKLTMKKSEIDAVVQDLHPGYDSRKVAKKFVEEFSTPLFEVQHHWAHAASLLVDNNLDESVVLALDGLGYGSDGKFWGGEVLVSNFNDFERVGHLEELPLLGGDQATKDPRRLVFAIFKKYGIEKFFSENEAAILSKLMDKSPQSTSLGRVLDAIACYFNICTKRTYDGEPAMKLEKYLAVGKPVYSFDVEIKNNVVGIIDLFRQMDEKIDKPLTEKVKADYVHSMVKVIIDSLTKIAIENAEKEGIKNIGLTGGVSYNIPITNMVVSIVKKAGLELTVHNRIPNGDGGISIGQNAIIGHKLKNV